MKANPTATPGALEEIERSGQTPVEFLNRHTSNDWGDLDKSDKKMNDEALLYGNRIFSAYYTNNKVKIWVITESDRSSTTLLLPSEY